MPEINITGKKPDGAKSPASGDLTDSMKHLIATVKRLDDAMEKMAKGSRQAPGLVDQYGVSLGVRAAAATKEQQTRARAQEAAERAAEKERRSKEATTAKNQRLLEKAAAKEEQNLLRKQKLDEKAASKEQQFAEKAAAKARAQAEKESVRQQAQAQRAAAREEAMASRMQAKREAMDQRAYARAYRQKNRSAAEAMAAGEAPEGAFGSPRTLRAWQNRRGMGAVGSQAWRAGGGMGAWAKTAAMRATGLVGAGIELPFLPGQIMNGILSTAQPAIDLTKGAYGLGRAGGFSGAGLFNTLYPGTGTTKGTEWMSDNMLTPSKVLESMAGYGISPRSAGQTKDMSIAFAQSNLSGGFSGMAPGTAERVARQGVGYGSAPNSAAGVASYLAPIEATMADAVAKGMDRTKVLASIQDSLDLMAKTGGVGASSSAATELISTLMRSGTAGGRTGQTALDLQSGMSGFVSNPSSAPVGQFMMYSQLPKYGMLKTDQDVEKFFGPKIMEQLNNSPEMKAKLFSDITEQAKSGNSSMALNTAMKFMGSDSMRALEMVRQAARESGVPGYMQNAMVAGSLPVNAPSIYALEAGEKAPGGGGTTAGIEAGFTESAATYKAQLKAAGVSDSVASALVSAGQSKGVSPMLLASIAKRESGLKQFKGGTPFNEPLYNAGGSGAVGLMQIMPTNGKYPAGVKDNMDENALVGSGILAAQLKAHGGDVGAALSGYGGFRTKNSSAYVGDIIANYRGMSSRANTPTGIGYAENLASQETIGSANFSLNNFVTKAEKLTTGMEHAGDAAATFAEKLTSAYKKFDLILAKTQGNHGGGMFDVDVKDRASQIWHGVFGGGSSSNASPSPAGQ